MENPSQTDARNQRILDNLHSAVLLLDQDFRLQYLNPAAEMLFDVSARQVVGTVAGDLLHCPSDLGATVLQRALDSGHPVTEREVTMPLSPGRTATIDCNVTPLVEPDGTTSLLVELQRLDHQLRMFHEGQLAAQQQATRALVRGLAHEIKTPLGGLRGAAQLLERELPTDSLRDYTNIIIEEAERLQMLVDRMPGPRTYPQRKLLNIHEALERVRMLVSAEQDADVKVINDYDPSIPELYADEDQLVQAVLNIVRNAAQAVGEKGRVVLKSRIERHMTIRQQHHKLAARISIIDDGPGIPPELREKIFYPMVTGRAEGTGLGLSIAQSIVHEHDGLIRCDSEPGRTQFSIFLPIPGQGPAEESDA